MLEPQDQPEINDLIDDLLLSFTRSPAAEESSHSALQSPNLGELIRAYDEGNTSTIKVDEESVVRGLNIPPKINRETSRLPATTEEDSNQPDSPSWLRVTPSPSMVEEDLSSNDSSARTTRPLLSPTAGLLRPISPTTAIFSEQKTPLDSSSNFANHPIEGTRAGSSYNTNLQSSARDHQPFFAGISEDITPEVESNQAIPFISHRRSVSTADAHLNMGSRASARRSSHQNLFIPPYDPPRANALGIYSLPTIHEHDSTNWSPPQDSHDNRDSMQSASSLRGDSQPKDSRKIDTSEKSFTDDGFRQVKPTSHSSPKDESRAVEDSFLESRPKRWFHSGLEPSAENEPSNLRRTTSFVRDRSSRNSPRDWFHSGLLPSAETEENEVQMLGELPDTGPSLYNLDHLSRPAQGREVRTFREPPTGPSLYNLDHLSQPAQWVRNRDEDQMSVLRPVQWVRNRIRRHRRSASHGDFLGQDYTSRYTLETSTSTPNRLINPTLETSTNTPNRPIDPTLETSTGTPNRAIDPTLETSTGTPNRPIDPLPHGSFRLASFPNDTYSVFPRTPVQRANPALRIRNGSTNDQSMSAARNLEAIETARNDVENRGSTDPILPIRTERHTGNADKIEQLLGTSSIEAIEEAEKQATLARRRLVRRLLEEDDGDKKVVKHMKKVLDKTGLRSLWKTFQNNK